LNREEIIFARTAPKHNMDIVMALKEMGEVVTVTGILIDDNFKSIVDAVMEGRTVFDNIKKFATYILGTEPPEVDVMDRPQRSRKERMLILRTLLRSYGFI
jgi:magnesium-transporting ATPase (P-type)